VLHISTLSFSLTDHRRHIALQLLNALRQLFGRVKKIDRQAWGVST